MWGKVKILETNECNNGFKCLKRGSEEEYDGKHAEVIDFATCGRGVRYHTCMSVGIFVKLIVVKVLF